MNLSCLKTSQYSRNSRFLFNVDAHANSPPALPIQIRTLSPSPSLALGLCA